ncbi:uncharacterized protein BXZ73DRAFT_42555 [Epithele typhae]|uniref:uncharacterized protein n=1 Tax=Epithele typhae TaxID=378194 RepID=UPI002007A0DC|nr:uncharacterized protein BXZ73DRAFT_42555 [Epithele typhae]KAH9940895.1 hypothetical protein BXZ73DRAFT_42555 [Epithele typhae]
MPPAGTQSNNAASRRSTGPIRQRENRVHNQNSQLGGAPPRRRKSRSPDARAGEEMHSPTDALARRKKRTSGLMGNGTGSSSSNPVNMATTRIVVYEDPQQDRGRIKSKPRSRPGTMRVDEDDDVHIVTNILSEQNRPATVQSSKQKRKEQRSRSRDAHRLSRKTATPEPSEDDAEPAHAAPLAQAEYVRMKQELESLRKQAAVNKKSMKAHHKTIEDLKTELKGITDSHRTQHAEYEKLKTQSKRSDDLVAAIESNLTCQICMELLLKPHALSPCGHILCMGCLLEWFKSAPPGDDEMLDEAYPHALLYRKKTCPCCRTVVRSKPVPLYLVKSLASALDKWKAPIGTTRRSPPPDDENPWAGIFREPHDLEDHWSTDEDDEDEDEEDEEDGEEEDAYDNWSAYGTDTDEEHYNGQYVSPRWAPPTVPVTPATFPFLDDDAEEIAMLRRGATMQMIEIFQMSYDHDAGLLAYIEGGNSVYLGWNIQLHPDDVTGEEYMDWIVSDMFDRPERWRVEHDGEFGVWAAWKLVREDEDEEFENTDSEMWLGEEDEDEDMY